MRPFLSASTTVRAERPARRHGVGLGTLSEAGVTKCRRSGAEPRVQGTGLRAAGTGTAALSTGNPETGPGGSGSAGGGTERASGTGTAASAPGSPETGTRAGLGNKHGSLGTRVRDLRGAGLREPRERARQPRHPEVLGPKAPGVRAPGVPASPGSGTESRATGGGCPALSPRWQAVRPVPGGRLSSLRRRTACRSRTGGGRAAQPGKRIARRRSPMSARR